MDSSDKAFLGTGWRFPPAFSRPARSVEMVGGPRDIHESLWVLFSTALGERVMLPEYGSGLWRLVFATINNGLEGELEFLVRKAILNWEPRVVAEQVAARLDPLQPGLVAISVDYRIRETNSRANLVYPFYIQEGTIPPVGP